MKKHIIGAFALILFCVYCFAQTNNTGKAPTRWDGCSTIFLKGVKPKYSIPATQELCNTEYAVLYSNYTKTPLISYERVYINDKGSIPRINLFKTDGRVTPYISKTSDYRNTGWDKGHLTPSGDMGDNDTQKETFLLTNIAPQAPKLNQQSWRLLESDIKNNNQWKYIITGVLFKGNKITVIGKDMVGVPTHFYKVVTDGKCSSAWIAENTQDGLPVSVDVKYVDVKYVEEMSEIDFGFPETNCPT